MKIIGIDLSLTSTGIAIIDTDSGITTRRVESKGKADATLQQRMTRLRTLTHDIHHTCQETQPDLILIEGPSFGSVHGHPHDRSGLWWLLVDTLDQLVSLEHPIVEVAPKCRMKYATGKGQAKKDDVLTAVIRRYPDVDVNGNDEADALILAAMGARWLGLSVDVLPKANLAAMDGVHWPAKHAVLL